MTLDTERRKESRKRPPSLVYVELASANGGMMRDICEEGFAVRVMMPLRIGDSTPFAFSLDASTRFEGSCQVLWVEEEGHVAGLKFTDVSPQLLEQVRVWLAEEETETDQGPVVPLREVNTLEELRAELRGVKPREEIPPPKTPAVEKAPRKIPKVESPRIEPQQVEVPRIAAPPLETPQVVPPRIETQRVEITRMEIPRVEEPTPKLRAEEEEIKALPPLEEMIAPPASREHEEITSRFPEEEEYEHTQREPPSFAERFSSQFEESIQEPPAFQPLPELREPGLLDTRLPRLDSTTVSLAIRILIFLALVAAAVVFHRDLGNGLIWLGAKLSGTNTQTASIPEGPTNPTPTQQTTPPSAQPPVSPPADTTPNSLSTTELKETNPAPSTAQTKKPGSTPAATANSTSSAMKPKNPSTTPATNKPSAQKPPSEPESEAGEQEYLQAQEMLKSGDREGGFQEAVRLLWIAVEKGNSKAEVSLAELYRRGEGVARNCDQARILLTAAARKGNADAQRRLQKFLREGCE
jgi:PilZ domain